MSISLSVLAVEYWADICKAVMHLQVLPVLHRGTPRATSQAWFYSASLLGYDGWCDISCTSSSPGVTVPNQPSHRDIENAKRRGNISVVDEICRCPEHHPKFECRNVVFLYFLRALRECLPLQRWRGWVYSGDCASQQANQHDFSALSAGDQCAQRPWARVCKFFFWFYL